MTDVVAGLNLFVRVRLLAKRAELLSSVRPCNRGEDDTALNDGLCERAGSER